MDAFGIAQGVATLYLLWQQNRILARQAPSPMPPPSWKQKLSSLRRYWPMTMMAILAAIAWYPRFVSPAPVDLPMIVTIAADNPAPSSPLSIITHQTFDGGDVPLDGYLYENCTFTENACLVYKGGAYRLENATFETRPRLCVDSQELVNYDDLIQALEISMGKPMKFKSRLVIPWWK